MYNEELKRQFIKTYTKADSVIRLCESVFNAFEDSENQWGADLCTRTADELRPVISKIVGFRVRSKWTRLMILKDYVRWCIALGIPDAKDAMLGITDVGIEKVKTQTIPNPKSLQKFLDAICMPEDSKTTDNTIRCYFWLAYAGMSEEDIFNVKCCDVDFDNMEVRYKKRDKTVPIYKESLKAFRNCVELDNFVYLHPNIPEPKLRPRIDGDLLLRGIRAQFTKNYIRVEMSRRAKEHVDDTALRLSYFRVWISGVFYRAYEAELSGEVADFSSIAADQMEGKTYKLDSGRNTIHAKHRQLTRDYEEDYERWKLAWH